VRHLFKPNDRVLEVGGGSGYQARCIADWGCNVLSIDLGSRAPSPQTFFDVTDYDGHHIPAANSSFDLVFSSNTLEHVPHLDELLAETKRVLRPGGLAIHILPSPAWRFWASAGFPVYALGYALGRYRPAEEVGSVERSVARRGRIGTAFRALLAPFRAHGEYPNAAAELYYFSMRRWRRVFHDAGFSVESAEPVGLFYTPYKMLNQSLTVEQRRTMSRWLGSACNVFFLSMR
jgi:SAM-dependent methyltransferase